MEMINKQKKNYKLGKRNYYQMKVI